MTEIPKAVADDQDASRWAFVTRWKVEPQFNDRPPMIGTVALITGSPASSRSIARRKRQAMFKHWSQSRHD